MSDKKLRYELAPGVVETLLAALNRVQFAGAPTARLIVEADAALREEDEKHLESLPKDDSADKPSAK